MSAQSIAVPVRMGQEYGFVRSRVLEDRAIELRVGGRTIELTVQMDPSAWETLVRVVTALRRGPIDVELAALLLLRELCPICHQPASEQSPPGCPAHLV